MRLALLGSRGYGSTYGGFETFITRLAPYLRDRGHEVTVYGRGAPGERDEDGIRCLSTRGLDSKALSTLSYGGTAIRHAARQGYDAVLVMNVTHGYFLPLLRRSRTPTVVNVDGLEWERGKWGRTGQAVLFHGARLTAAWADALVVDSQALAPVWRRRFNRDAVYIPYGGDGDPVAHVGALQSLGIEPDNYLLVVARLVPENRVDLVLDAVERRRPAMPLVVVGSANYRAPIVERLRALHAEGVVRWVGHVDDRAVLAALWAHCSVYIHAHTVGGTNPALLQALGAGACTVAVDTPFNREVVDGEQLFPPDADALGDVLVRLLADPHVRRRMANRGAAIVRDRYRWDSVCRRYEQLLTHVAGLPPAGAAATRMRIRA